MEDDGQEQLPHVLADTVVEGHHPWARSLTPNLRSSHPQITLRMRHASSEVPTDPTSSHAAAKTGSAEPVETRTPEQVKADGMTLWKKMVEYQDKESVAPLLPRPPSLPTALTICVTSTGA